MSNNDFVLKYYKLIKECVHYQIKSAGVSYGFYDDLLQHIVLVILEYNNEKLNDIDKKNHANAFITRLIQNNIRSSTSKFYYLFRKFNIDSKEITTLYDYTA